MEEILYSGLLHLNNAVRGSVALTPDCSVTEDLFQFPIGASLGLQRMADVIHADANSHENICRVPVDCEEKNRGECLLDLILRMSCVLFCHDLS